MHPALGIREDEHAETRLPEARSILAGERELEIVPGLLLPDRERLVPEVHFEERGDDP